ncbi:hypothetical protein NDU88_004031 [Pleurodeles waltl]|uniref:Uncharacterized protein n=1 Tax=Pleurodeles waltl TaxID=8319 RepID=A0AAV7V396_PLEWA|nr:hypothetical protein NDU88_004031 [Pleurodeles waltl]
MESVERELTGEDMSALVKKQIDKEKRAGQEVETDERKVVKTDWRSNSREKGTRISGIVVNCCDIDKTFADGIHCDDAMVGIIDVVVVETDVDITVDIDNGRRSGDTTLRTLRLFCLVVFPTTAPGPQREWNTVSSGKLLSLLSKLKYLQSPG